MKNEDIEIFVSKLRSTFQRIADIKFPTIAGINGFALGGGLELALACDFRYSTNLSKVGLPEVGLGIIPGAGGTQRLPKLIGQSKALELILTGKRLSATEAHQIGLINYVFDSVPAMEIAVKDLK